MTMMQEEYWDELAKEKGIRLPRRDAKKWAQRAWLKKIGLAPKDYVAVIGGPASGFLAMNPAWTFRQWAGLALEILCETREAV